MLNHPAVKMTPPRRRMADVLHHQGRSSWWCSYCGIALVPLGTIAAVAATVVKPTGVIDAAPGYAWPSVDHKVPRHHGGTDDLDNLTLACVPCNTRKGTRSEWEFYALLIAELPAEAVA